MIKVITYKEDSFFVTDDKGLSQLQNVFGLKMNLNALTCGHYITPGTTTTHLESTDCPVCGEYYTVSGMEPPHEYMNGKKLRPKCMHIECIDTAETFNLSPDLAAIKPPKTNNKS